VFVDKRKEFNSAAARKPDDLIAMENEQKMNKKKSKKGNVKVSRNDNTNTDNIYNNENKSLGNENGNKNAMPKWKAQSEQLKLAMKANKKGGLTQEEQVQMAKATEEADTRTQCPLCMRKFNQETFKRH